MSDARLPAHLEVSGLLRAVEAAGGFAMVLARGERDAGTILVVCCVNGRDGRLYERMPGRDGMRSWTLVKEQDSQAAELFSDYISRRREQDRDLWVVELDIVRAERFIGLDPEKD